MIVRVDEIEAWLGQYLAERLAVFRESIDPDAHPEPAAGPPEHTAAVRNLSEDQAVAALAAQLGQLQHGDRHDHVR